MLSGSYLPDQRLCTAGNAIPLLHSAATWCELWRTHGMSSLCEECKTESDVNDLDDDDDDFVIRSYTRAQRPRIYVRQPSLVDHASRHPTGSSS